MVRHYTKFCREEIVIEREKFGYDLDSLNFWGFDNSPFIAASAFYDPTWLTNLLVKMGARSLTMPGVLGAYRLSLSPGAPSSCGAPF
jgi:hypothetical protein